MFVFYMNNSINYISIPKGLPSKIVQNNRDFKMLVVFYQLKSLYVGGIIHDYTKKYDVIAEKFGISSSKLRSYISILLKMGWVYKDKNKSLVIRSKKMLSEAYGVSKYCYKIKIDVINDLENVIRTLVIKENQEKQVHLLKKKFVDRQLDKEGRASSSKILARQTKIIKKYVNNNFENLVEKEKIRLRGIGFHDNCTKLIDEINKLNPFISTSRFNVSKILNRRSKSTGSRYVKKLLDKNYLYSDTTNSIVIDNNRNYMDIFTYNTILLEKYNKYYHIYYKKGLIYLKLSNSLTTNESLVLMN